jgi:ring-1,2-phenylacetyl-CoA epoxidase subunit PaaE
MSRFQKAKVSHIHRETPDSVSISLEIEENKDRFFPFKPGQYLTFKKIFNDKEIRRTYSICSSPSETTLQVGIKQLKGGLFSTWANNDLNVGDWVEIMPPMGRFVLPETAFSNGPLHIVGFTAGSGITPVLSHIKHLLESQIDVRFTLFYGNKTLGTTMFRETLEGLKNKYPNRFSLYYILSREASEFDLFAGRIDARKCSSYLEKLIPASQVDYFMICGPGEMIDEVQQFLLSSGIESHKILTERFTAPGIPINARPEEISETSPNSEYSDSQVTVILDGLCTQFNLNTAGAPVLDAALEAGADVPYACKGAVCCTCKAKVISGEVKLDLNYALSEEELRNGFILTCQAHPISEEVVISYDELG